MNTTKCSVCGAQYPHQKNGFYGIIEHFGWNNVHVFSAWDDESDDEYEDEEEEYEEPEEIIDTIKPDYLRLVQLDQHGPKNDK